MNINKKAGMIAIGCGCVFALFLTLAGVRACRVSNNYSKLEGENVLLKANVAKIKAEAEKDRAVSNEKIAVLNASIIEHQHNEVILDQKLATGDSDLAKLKANFSLIKDCPGQVVNLQAQVANLEQTKTDLGQKIEEIQGERDDWHGKYDAQITVSETWKKQYLAEVGLNENLEKGKAQLRTDLWWAKLGSNLKMGAMIVEAGLFGYLYLRKK